MKVQAHHRLFYRNPIFWVITAIPLLSIVVSVVLIVLAARTHSAPLSLSQPRAELVADRLRLDRPDGEAPPPRLRLRLINPRNRAEQHRFPLAAAEDGYPLAPATLALLQAEQRWEVLLEDPDGRWQISGLSDRRPLRLR